MKAGKSGSTTPAQNKVSVIFLVRANINIDKCYDRSLRETLVFLPNSHFFNTNMLEQVTLETLRVFIAFLLSQP